MISRFRNSFIFLLLSLGLQACTSESTSAPKNVGTVQVQDLVQKVTLAGTIEPQRTSSILAPYDGYVKKLYVRIGDKVKKGDPLVAISENLSDPGPFFPIRAPFAGTITQVNVKEEGFAKAQDSQLPLVKLDDLNGFLVRSVVPEADILKVKAGQSSIIKASAILNKNYEGTVEEVALSAEIPERYSRSQSTQFPVVVRITNPDEQLRAGMSVIADVISKKIEKALVLPHIFISSSREGSFVTKEDGTKVQIQIGAQNDMFSEVKGLKEGDRVQQIDFYSMGGSSR